MGSFNEAFLWFANVVMARRVVKYVVHQLLCAIIQKCFHLFILHVNVNFWQGATHRIIIQKLSYSLFWLHQYASHTTTLKSSFWIEQLEEQELRRRSTRQSQYVRRGLPRRMDDDIYDAPDYDRMEESFHYGGHVQSEYYNSRYKWKQWITGNS